MPPQGNDKSTTPEGMPEKTIGSLDASKAYAEVAQREALSAKQKAEELLALQKKQSAEARVTDQAASARADILAAPGASPASAPDHSPEKEERRYQDSLGKLSSSSICPDLVSIIKKNAGAKVDQNAPDTQFSTLAGSVLQNLESLDPDIFKKSQTDQAGNFKPFRSIMEKWINQEISAATPDKAPHLREVANTFRTMMDIVEKTEPSAAPAQPAEATAATPATPPATKPEGFLGEIFDKLKGFLAQFSAWIGNIFKPTNPPTTAAPAPAPAVSLPPTPPPTPAPQLPANPDTLRNPDATSGLKGQPLLDNEQFRARTDQIAAKIGVSRSDLYAIFKMESKADPAIQNPTTHATGLIQWMPDTAPNYGTSVEQLKLMSGLQQLDYVEKYFRPHFGKLHRFSDLYRAVFFPAAIGKGDDYVFQTSKLSAQKVAHDNSGIDQDNGVITNASFERYCAKRRPSDSGVPLSTSSNSAIA